VNRRAVSNNISWGGLIAMGLLFMIAFAYLFALRFESGDFLPAYSSLRRDPLGTGVLFESLRESGLQVERNHEKISQADIGSKDTLLFAGHKGGPFEILGNDSTHQTIKTFVEGGGRLIITHGALFSPKRTENSEDSDHKPCPEEEDEEKPPFWTVSITQAAAREDMGSPSMAAGTLFGQHLNMIWTQDLVFSNPGPEWQTILSRNGEPVLIERKFGAGTVVLATSSYFLSNEAMLRERQLTLLTWLIGHPRRMIFDEFHHGLQSKSSITGLIRNYNLHGVIFLLLLLVALFLWRNGLSLLPRHSKDPNQIHLHAGRDPFEGMVGLLRRHPPENLLMTTLTEWQRGNRPWCQKYPTRLQEMQELANPRNKITKDEQLSRYQNICRILHTDKSTNDKQP